jgi:hypothetical protein
MDGFKPNVGTGAEGRAVTRKKLLAKWEPVKICDRAFNRSLSFKRIQ